MATELKPARRQRRCAFSLIELLLALAIGSILLAAAATAIKVTTNTVNANEWYARLTMKGRNALVRLIDQARAADAHSPYTTSGGDFTAYSASGQPMSDIGIQFADAGPNGPDVPVGTLPTVYTYWWDKTKQQLLVKTSVGSTVTATGVLLDGVTNFQVTMWPGRSDPQNATYDAMLRATLLIRFADTDPTTHAPQTVTLSGSVVPRKNVWTGQKLEYPIQLVLNNTH